MDPRLAVQLQDRSIRSAFGDGAYQRGSSYARAGHVVSLDVDEDGLALYGVVLGSGGCHYETVVALEPGDRPGAYYIDTACSCPLGCDCKHAVATMLSAQLVQVDVPAAPPPLPDWERALAPVLTRTQPAGAVPLALQLEVSPAPRRRVRLRPVLPGRSGSWVRTGVGWSDLRYADAYSGYDARHRAALRELCLAHESGPLARYSPYQDAMYLDEFGPSLWRLLEQSVEAGVELVPAKAAAGPVVLSPRPATVALDLTLDPASGAAGLAPRLEIGGQEVPLALLDTLGSPAHGVVVHSEPGLLLVPLETPMDPAADRLLKDPGPMHIPGADLDRFLADYFPRLQRAIAVVSSDDSVSLPEVSPARLSLTVLHKPEHRVVLEWGFEYQVGEQVHRFALDDDPGSGLRDPAREVALMQSVDLPMDRLTQLRVGPAGRRTLVSPVILAGMDAVQFVDAVLPELLEREDVVVRETGDRPEFREAEEAPRVLVSATDSADSDWFDLGVTVWVGGEEVPFDSLFTALAGGESHLLLPSGVWFGLDRDELRQLRGLIEEARGLQDRPGGPLQISRYQAGLWGELRRLGVVEQQSDRWAATVEGLLDFDEADRSAGLGAPLSLAAALRPYQLDGYRWLSFLWDHGLGGILADDMGLGKTVQTLAMLCRAHEAGRLEAPALVVAPTSVVRNWANEAARFAPGLRVVTVDETESRRGVPLAEHAADADLVVTSYALFRIEYPAYAEIAWSGLLLDEAQFVKNHQAKTYQCVRRLPAPFKLAITGTPLENSLMDLWALLSIVAPGLFPSPQRFGEFYRKPIERGGNRELLSTLRRRIRPLVRRRTKEEVATELPPKQEQVLEVELNPRHRKIYETHLQRERQKILGLIGDLDKNRFTILKSLTLLRQLSLDPVLVDQKYAGVRSAKVEAFVEHLHQLVGEGHRALVFSQFTGFLGRIREQLDAEGVEYAYLDGRTRNRDRAIARFKDGDAPVFLISLKAGGFGLNLTEADYCFVLDPWWNPATEAQAVDRTHRIGQDKHVVVYRLVSTGTIEEKVMALKERKAELFRNVMADDGMLSGPMSAEDIRSLLEA